MLSGRRAAGTVGQGVSASYSFRMQLRKSSATAESNRGQRQGPLRHHRRPQIRRLRGDRHARAGRATRGGQGVGVGWVGSKQGTPWGTLFWAYSGSIMLLPSRY